MRRFKGCLGALSVSLALVSCQSPVPAPIETAEGQFQSKRKGEVVIQVTSNGWHSGIVVARLDLSADAIPEAADFPEARYLNFGWGDAEYYPAPRPTFAMALDAALRPTPAVVHLAGLTTHPKKAFPQDEVLELSISTEGFQWLTAFLAASFDRAGRPRAEPKAPGLYSFSRFYPATGKFHIFNTCNTWTARALAAAGVPVDTTASTRAEDLMAQLRQLRRTRPRRSRRPVVCSSR